MMNNKLHYERKYKFDSKINHDNHPLKYYRLRGNPYRIFMSMSYKQDDKRISERAIYNTAWVRYRRLGKLLKILIE